MSFWKVKNIKINGKIGWN